MIFIDGINMKEFSQKELENSKRIFKSATPKGDLSWYIKWASSFIILVAITIRSAAIPELMLYDMFLSWIGAVGWFIVGYLWRDRAIIVLNGVIGIILFSGILNQIW